MRIHVHQDIAHLRELAHDLFLHGARHSVPRTHRDVWIDADITAGEHEEI